MLPLRATPLFYSLTLKIIFWSLLQDFFGDAAKDEFVSKLIWGIDLSLGLICNLLFLIAIVYSLAVMILVIFPTSILKVHLTRKFVGQSGHVVCFGREVKLQCALLTATLVMLAGLPYSRFGR